MLERKKPFKTRKNPIQYLTTLKEFATKRKKATKMEPRRKKKTQKEKKYLGKDRSQRRMPKL